MAMQAKEDLEIPNQQDKAYMITPSRPSRITDGRLNRTIVLKIKIVTSTPVMAFLRLGES